MAYDPGLFAEKYWLALESGLKDEPSGGLCGFELEWNLLDAGMRPLLTVGSGPGQQSFVDYLRGEVLSPWLRPYSQLEVFHWMVEWATRPYYHPRGAVYEGRLFEAVLVNAMRTAGRRFEERLYIWPGNLLFLTQISHDSIPGAWHLAKRRYLERCVDLYGEALATAGTHANLSLPNHLLAWDFMHLSPAERGDRQLDTYKSEIYITITRLMRAFAALFVATSAATPLQARLHNGQPVVVLTEIDSVRNLTFPNPPEIDRPDLYRSYADYLRISYDLVRRGIRFGNNNWTPVRTRSFAEPVERLIAVTSEQLGALYARGLYSTGDERSHEDMAAEIEQQNLLARIDLPMSRVEVRTDDGGHPLELEVANLTLKHLLMLRFYADPEFGRAFRYDDEDLRRARRNEMEAARNGMRATIENPLSGKLVGMREFLRWTLNALQPLAEATGYWEDLQPLVEIAEGAPNMAERLRQRLHTVVNERQEVPLETLVMLAEEREAQLSREVGMIAEEYRGMQSEAVKLGEFLQRARDDVHLDPYVPIRFRPRPEAQLEIIHPDTTSEIVALAQELIRIPSVTACPDERLDEVRRAATLIYDYARNSGLGVRYYDQHKYPALLLGFPGEMLAPVMLSGHFDVVAPEPDDSQFTPQVKGEYLWGRGAADMKTVVATNLVWMKDRLHQPAPYPPVNLLLIGNEENGETEAMGTPQLLHLLQQDSRYSPQLLIAGERTGEQGDELFGEVCLQNRGVMRFDIIARGQRGHTGITGVQGDLTEKLLVARAGVTAILGKHLTLSSPDGWHSQMRFPFIQVGTPGVYNISADFGVIGVEVRPIPQDDMRLLMDDLRSYCLSLGLEMVEHVSENGIACDPQNRYLQPLLSAIAAVSGAAPKVGRKLPGTSARFAPGGQGAVWGQAGIGPHSSGERHFIPSILPYYHILDDMSQRLAAMTHAGRDVLPDRQAQMRSDL